MKVITGLKHIVTSVLLVGCALSFAQEEVIYDRQGRKLPDAEVNSAEVNWTLVKLAEGSRYNGIGLLDLGGGGGCTATLIDSGAVSNAPAYVLTNGHCAGRSLLGPDEVAVNKMAPEGMNVKFNFFIDAEEKIRPVPVRRILYATMKHTDIALLELDIPYAQLRHEGFAAYVIADKDPRVGTPVEMVGIPQSGVKRSMRYVRRSECALGERANLREGDYRFLGGYKHTCSSVGGSSGTAMISLKTRRIVAINNTGVSDRAESSPECAMNRPCEVSQDGSVRTDFSVNYAQRVSEIPSCFDDNGFFDLRQQGCRLAKSL